MMACRLAGINPNPKYEQQKLNQVWALACAGPFFEVKDHLQFINHEGVWARDAKGGPPSPVVPGLLRLAKVLSVL